MVVSVCRELLPSSVGAESSGSHKVLSSPSTSGLQHHGHVHRDAAQWAAAEDLSRQHPGEDIFPV